LISKFVLEDSQVFDSEVVFSLDFHAKYR
jgi:hypothetical protein